MIVLIAVALMLCIAKVTLAACDGLFGGKDSDNNKKPSGNIEEQDPDAQASFEFRLLEDGTYSLKRYKGKQSNVIIPDEYEGKAVTSIGEGAFALYTGLQTVTIGENVTSIGDEAFAECTGLTEIIIPGSVTSIGTEAFSDCISLKDIYYAGDETQWRNIKKGDNWDEYFDSDAYYDNRDEYYDDDSDWYRTIDYQLHYNSTWRETESVALNELGAPIAWGKKRFDFWGK